MIPARALVWALLAAVSGPVVAAPQRVTLVCDAVYLPARSSWTRTVDIAYDNQRVRSVEIDGVAVYTFAIAGTLILTSQDNERIRIDTAAQTWSSDFRGLATAEGRCER
nr:hypothetical protein [Hydrogenophaga sp.]